MAEKYGDTSKELKEFRKTVKEFLEAFLSEYKKEQPTHSRGGVLVLSLNLYKK